MNLSKYSIGEKPIILMKENIFEMVNTLNASTTLHGLRFFLFLQFIARCITAERKTNFPPVISDECETNGRDTARRHRLVSGN